MKDQIESLNVLSRFLFIFNTSPFQGGAFTPNA